MRATGTLGALLLIVAMAGPTWAELYRWTDGDGIAHYTADPASIPPEFRASATVTQAPRAPDAPPRPAVQPTVISFTPGGPIIVSALLNGVAVRLLVDTGADRTMITPAVAARAGMGEPQGRSVQIVGVTGRASAVEGTVSTLDLAGTRLGNVSVIVHEPRLANADGLLGRDILDAFTLTVDPAQGRATIVPR